LESITVPQGTTPGWDGWIGKLLAVVPPHCTLSIMTLINFSSLDQFGDVLMLHPLMNALRIYTECHYAECHSKLVAPENITKEFSNTNALAYFT
jgi:hypothetical protein